MAGEPGGSEKTPPLPGTTAAAMADANAAARELARVVGAAVSPMLRRLTPPWAIRRSR